MNILSKRRYYELIKDFLILIYSFGLFCVSFLNWHILISNYNIKMGGLFSKEEKSKPLSYQNNSTYKREYQPTNTSYHVPNNFERLEISSPSIRKGKIEVSTNFERIWMK